MESLDALYGFWQWCNLAPAVSLCLLLFNGATSFRAASDSQKRRFRKFARQVALRKDRAAARDIDSYEIRERGVQKAIAVLFLFHPQPTEDPSSAPTCRFLLPLWQAKNAEPIPLETRVTVGQVTREMLGMATLEKVSFEVKELLCCLMRFFHWDATPPLASVVDVQLGAWLLTPNAGEKDRAKYQLLSLLAQHCQHESDYPIDVSEKPADILRALLVDLPDVWHRLWPAIKWKLSSTDMIDVFTVQVSRGAGRMRPPASGQASPHNHLALYVTAWDVGDGSGARAG